MGVKPGCLLSPALIGLCIDELEDSVNMVQKINTMSLTYGNISMAIPTKHDPEQPICLFN